MYPQYRLSGIGDTYQTGLLFLYAGRVWGGGTDTGSLIKNKYFAKLLDIHEGKWYIITVS